MPAIARPLPFVRPAPVACPVPLLRARDVPHAARVAARGELVSVVRGVYAPTGLWRRLAPWDRYLARIHATLLTHPGLVLSHESAAAIWGMPVLGDPGVVHALGDPTRTSRLHAGLRMHTTTGARDVVDLGGFAAVAPADCAVDLARARHVVVGLIAPDAALRLDPAASVESLFEQNEHRPSSRGRRIARWPLHRARAEAESTLESASRAIIELLGYEEPELQTEWSGQGATDRTDFWWPGAGVAGEADGDLTYDGRFGDPGSLLRARRERDHRLRSRGIRSVVHWGWSDVADPDALDGILRGAGVPRVALPDAYRLATARTALGSRHPAARLHTRAETGV
ncbi:hypothetical protein AB0P19_03210 [Microbacterium oleivorans]|uniref:hypothetical protein n=1 Tax=Microbacterium oleivorans TaxID=273677 RepID=UPI0033C1561A